MSKREVRIVVQARLGSSRLPGKALLPLAGIPMCALAALRASSRGHEVVLATSTLREDDLVAQAARRHGVPVVRGPLEDTLARFVQAASGLGDDAAVVRLTADNVVPDGALIDQALTSFDAAGGEYWHASHVTLTAPYGVSAEVMSAGALRLADARATSRYDREHVTPWIRRSWTPPSWTVSLTPTSGRCTVDNIDDYEIAARIFSEVADPIGIGWRVLADRFVAATSADQFPIVSGGSQRESVLVLGTAQLGSDYGIANDNGMPDDRSADEVLRAGVAHGVTHVDTASAYGHSEARIGGFLARGYRDRFSVMTKVEPLPALAPDAAREYVRASVFRSIARLRADPLGPLPSVDTVMVHRAADATSADGAGWSALRAFRDEGTVRRIGISVQSPEEATVAAALPDVSVVQLPFNALDRRWDRAGEDLAEAGIDVIARSVFLQGLLTGRVPVTRWPTASGFDAKGTMAALERITRDAGVDDVTTLALAFVLCTPWVHQMVVGCETGDQIADLAVRLRVATIDPAVAKEIESVFRDVPEEILNPALWKRARVGQSE